MKTKTQILLTVIITDKPIVRKPSNASILEN